MKPLGAVKPAVAEAELQAVAVDVAGQLAAHRLVLALALEGDRPLKGDAADGLLDLGRGLPGSVRPADQRTHARADDAVDRDAQLLEHRQHADVRRALGAAAAEHQTDARPRLRCAAAAACARRRCRRDRRSERREHLRDERGREPRTGVPAGDD